MKHAAGKLFDRFHKDESGNFATIAALSALVMMMSAGVAVDYTNFSRSKQIMEHSLDAAILATGSEMKDGEKDRPSLRQTFENHLFANLERHQELARKTEIVAFQADPNKGKISARLTAPMQTSFLAITGRESVPVSAESEASFNSNPVEISMVLDVTGSMRSEGKIDDLKLAAADAVDILIPDPKRNNQVRIGLVPYSEGVRLPNALAETASGQTDRDCMTERRRNASNDAAPVDEPIGSDSRANCSSSYLRPLTDNATDLKADIASLRTGGYTAGHSGIAWAHYMLSQKWRSFWPAPAKPSPDNGKARKIAVLMTDGEFNTYFEGVSGNRPQGRGASVSNRTATELCQDMKRARGTGEGVIIYSIAFKAPPSAKATLRDCASLNENGKRQFFEAKNGAELRTAFRSIAKSIDTLRLSR